MHEVCCVSSNIKRQTDKTKHKKCHFEENYDTLQDALDLVLGSMVLRISLMGGHLPPSALMHSLMRLVISCHCICLIVCSLSLGLLGGRCPMHISIIKIPKLNTSIFGVCWEGMPASGAA